MFDAGTATLYIVGGGDTALALGAGDPNSVLGRAGIADLADAAAAKLRQGGHNSVKIAVDDTLFVGDSVHPRWPANSVANGDVSPITALGVYMSSADGQAPAPIPTDPSLFVVQTFSTELAARGVQVAQEVVRQVVPATAEEVAKVESATIGELIRHTLVVSDNTRAEALCRLVAVHRGQAGDFLLGAQVVSNVLKEHQIDVGSDTVIDDCSGLSRYNKVSAQALGNVLAASRTVRELGYVARGLPIAGYTGTLGKRFVTSQGTQAGAGVVRAKTGYIDEVYSLTGVVTTSQGRLLIVVLICNDPPPETVPTRAFDTFYSHLATV
jgi:D-alanyl-D-alanine carboxypeptidase/D-alanyl-D-alanine-endopeptidase (penicillin-binding protein 4)